MESLNTLSWICPACTFRNSQRSLKCGLCGHKSVSSWECHMCSLLNSASSQACGACGSAPRFQQGREGLTSSDLEAALSKAQSSLVVFAPTATEWKCQRCTYVNSESLSICAVCQSAKPASISRGAEGSKSGFRCIACSVQNSGGDKCSVCNTDRPSTVWYI